MTEAMLNAAIDDALAKAADLYDEQGKPDVAYACRKGIA